MPEEQLTRERIRLQACRNVNSDPPCPCDHVHCCDGWLIPPPLTRAPAQRCPTCFDAVLMRAEMIEQAEVRHGKRRQWGDR